MIPKVLNSSFDKKIQSYLDFSVPVISPDELKTMKDEIVLLDTREREEYDISHIDGATFAGYNAFDKKIMQDIPKDAKIVVYCSIGYRSEKIGEKLQKMGYGQVYNLYGSIFEWVNQGNELVNENQEKTSKIHTYNKSWSKWVDSDKVEKIW
jgi:rhodanese-related sulfurtransferase